MDVSCSLTDELTVKCFIKCTLLLLVNLKYYHISGGLTDGNLEL